MYPVIYKVLDNENKIKRLIIIQENGEYDEYIAGETLYHESDTEYTKEKSSIYKNVRETESYLKPVMLGDCKLQIIKSASLDDIEKNIDRVKSQYRGKITPKRDRKRRR